jgi:hypothetical protein
VVATQISRQAKQQEQAVADRILRDRAYAGRHFDTGDYIAILGEEIVAVGRSYDAVAAALGEREPRRDRGMICLVSDAGPDVVR